MSRQSIGVTPFKHLIKWMYPRAVAAFDGCAKIHDEQYKGVNWSMGSEATAKIDWDFYMCCLFAAGDDIDLKQQAHTFYRVARKWGIGRAYLWKLYIRW